MYGAIVGDIAGSIYEYEEFKDSLNGRINKKRRLSVLAGDLITDKCFYGDDTILTIAILDAIINNKSYEDCLKKYGLDNIDHVAKKANFFKYPFSPRFTKWLNDDIEGNSKGNGAMMRISPVGYLFDNINDVIKESKKATSTSHNSLIAIKGAEIVASVIFYFRNGYSKDRTIHLICEKYNIDIDYSVDDLRDNNRFDDSCSCISFLLYIIKISNGFEDAIRLTLSIGGDTDTNACIVGSMAEALYGIPIRLVKEVNKIIPKEYVSLLQDGYKIMENKKNK